MNAIRIPFSLADEVIHHFDRPPEPQSVHLEIRISGSLDRERLASAVGAALTRHPMARARQATRRFLTRPPHWEIPDSTDLDPGSVVRTITFRGEADLNDARSRFYSMPIDIRRSPALRILHVARSAGDHLLIGFNHAVCDGISALRFLNTVGRAYDGRPDPLPPIDPLAVRDYKKLLAGPDAQEPPRPIGRPSGHRLATDVLSPSGGAPLPGYGFYFRVIPLGTGFRFERPQAAPIATFNDVLLAALHRAIESWNWSLGRPCENISVLMPINLRHAAWHSEVIGNFVRSVRIITSASQRADLEVLLATIAAQTRYYKLGGATAVFRTSPVVRNALPLLLPLLQAPVVGRRQPPAAVLTNFGKLDACPDFGRDGGHTVELWAAAPTAMPLGLSVGTATLGDRLHVAYRYRRALFDELAAQAFAGLFEEELGLYCGAPAEHALA